MLQIFTPSVLPSNLEEHQALSNSSHNNDSDLLCLLNCYPMFPGSKLSAINSGYDLDLPFQVLNFVAVLALVLDMLVERRFCRSVVSLFAETALVLVSVNVSDERAMDRDKGLDWGAESHFLVKACHILQCGWALQAWGTFHVLNFMFESLDLLVAALHWQ
ncbi:hypothetical protein B0T26DRAFT_680347 [Lasiosphaeria miniovina]|uniref:Uncharacterized protein n=1 Tax=Lasiosphaeria miniovina TaxID=1954250 RepID=A0AA40DNT7_9PEZI|nr:uncharacterized protein B0T26DRAFT_680347 [Lasiosphaeria miniovina]KAK0706698.1 hypothetical protein B0T26DRAFT_680347 [Lasiosphaeria miniovina]